MTRSEVLERLCALSTKVGEKAYDNDYGHDCFCDMRDKGHISFEFNERVIRFIECAVEEALAKKNKK